MYINTSLVQVVFWHLWFLYISVTIRYKHFVLFASFLAFHWFSDLRLTEILNSCYSSFYQVKWFQLYRKRWLFFFELQHETNKLKLWTSLVYTEDVIWINISLNIFNVKLICSNFNNYSMTFMYYNCWVICLKLHKVSIRAY